MHDNLGRHCKLYKYLFSVSHRLYLLTINVSCADFNFVGTFVNKIINYGNNGCFIRTFRR